MSQVSGIVVVIVSVIVSVIVFVFVFVFLLVRSGLLITLIKCLKGYKSLGMLSGSVFNNGQLLTYSLSHSVTSSPIELSGNS